SGVASNASRPPCGVPVGPATMTAVEAANQQPPAPSVASAAASRCAENCLAVSRRVRFAGRLRVLPFFLLGGTNGRRVQLAAGFCPPSPQPEILICWCRLRRRARKVACGACPTIHPPPPLTASAPGSPPNASGFQCGPFVALPPHRLLCG